MWCSSKYYYNYPKDPSGFDEWNKTLHQRLGKALTKVEAFGTWLIQKLTFEIREILEKITNLIKF